MIHVCKTYNGDLMHMRSELVFLIFVVVNISCTLICHAIIV